MYPGMVTITDHSQPRCGQSELGSMQPEQEPEETCEISSHVADQIRKCLEKAPRTSNDLLNMGFAVLENAMDADTLYAIREEIELLDNSDWLQKSPSMIKVGENESVELVKQGIKERSIVLRGNVVADDSMMSMLPTLSQFWDGKDHVVTGASSKIIS